MPEAPISALQRTDTSSGEHITATRQANAANLIRFVLINFPFGEISDTLDSVHLSTGRLSDQGSSREAATATEAD